MPTNRIEDPYDPNEQTYPCRVCGRQFIKSSLVKHESACKKLQKLNRKVFDSGKQRAQGSDVPYAAIKKAQKEKEKFGGQFPRPKTHWRERHEEFIGAVSASKQVEHALKTGAPLPPPPRTSLPSDHVQCQYCGRNFNERAAERHIPFCREQHARQGTTVKRSASTGRAPTSKSQVAPPTRSKLVTSRDNSPATAQRATTNRANRPPSRRSSQDRVDASRREARPVANSASMAQRTSLPTPVKRSNSAPKTPAPPGQSRGNLKTSKPPVRR